MTIKLLPGVLATDVVRTLTQVQYDLHGSGPTPDVYRAYMQWVGNAVKQLRYRGP